MPPSPILPPGRPSCLCHACASPVWQSRAALIKRSLTPTIIYATCTLSLIDICLDMYKISTENAVAPVPFVSVSPVTTRVDLFPYLCITY